MQLPIVPAALAPIPAAAPHPAGEPTIMSKAPPPTLPVSSYNYPGIAIIIMKTRLLEMRTQSSKLNQLGGAGANLQKQTKLFFRMG